MSKAIRLSRLERKAREQDLVDYRHRIGPAPSDIADYDFRRGWEYCLGRFGRTVGYEWTEEATDE